MIRWVTAAFLVLLAAAGASAYVLSQPRLAAQMLPRVAESIVDRLEPPVASSGPIAFTVQPGELGSTVAERLAAAGLIHDPRAFRYLLAFYGAETGLRAGEYRLDPAAGTRGLIKQLMGQSSDKLVSVTVPEGLRAEEVAAILQQAGVASGQEFLQLVFTGRSGGGSLEGYLYPETYHVPAGYGAQQMLTMMMETFRERAQPYLEKAAGQGLTPQQALTLASIVERETALPDERPVLAGVYLNRLRLGMTLDADPTVQYALVAPGAPPPPVGYWKRDLTVEDLRRPSPYNTYVTSGLPPAPIANPGLGAIRGVAEPVASRYLYFVARPDRSHALAETFAEHQANVLRYQR